MYHAVLQLSTVPSLSEITARTTVSLLFSHQLTNQRTMYY